MNDEFRNMKGEAMAGSALCQFSRKAERFYSLLSVNRSEESEVRSIREEAVQ